MPNIQVFHISFSTARSSGDTQSCDRRRESWRHPMYQKLQVERLKPMLFPHGH
jgi:hypothetical protein